jgi:hypothetical protein
MFFSKHERGDLSVFVTSLSHPHRPTNHSSVRASTPHFFPSLNIVLVGIVIIIYSRSACFYQLKQYFFLDKLTHSCEISCPMAFKFLSTI